MEQNEASGKKPDKGGLGEPLYEPKDGKAEVDIVFVHGINGDRIDTWTYKNDKLPVKNRMWPQHKDFLPAKLPNARIVSFGYNADFARFYTEDENIAPELTIEEYSTSLLESVRALRQGGDEERPIIFVAHSMGGLVVANAISRNFTSQKEFQPIPDHTIGLLFLGTPFQGSDVASYGSIALSIYTYILGKTQPDSLDLLKKKSKRLVKINHEFAKFLHGRYEARDKPKLQIACFVEGIPIVGEKLVVPKESATWLGIDPLSIDADHMDMCRFDFPSREGYGKISGKLVQWVEDYKKEKSEPTGGVGGLNGRGGVIQSGPTGYQGATISGSNTAGNIYSATRDATRMEVKNYTYAGSPPPPPPGN